IGNPCEMSVLQIAQDVISATGSSSAVTYVDRPVDDPKVRRPDTTLAGAELGWQPQVAWEVGLSRTVAWFADGLSRSAGPFRARAGRRPPARPPRRRWRPAPGRPGRRAGRRVRGRATARYAAPGPATVPTTAAGSGRTAARSGCRGRSRGERPRC